MSKSIIIDEAGLPKTLTVDALRIEKLGVGSEDWAFASGETSSFVKMSIGENAEVDATDYDAKAITEVDVTQDIYGIETQPDEVEVITEPRNVSISEGNQPRIISPVKKVRVNLQAGGTIDLLPKSSIATGTLYATKRGHYAAKDDGYVGYSKVYVNVPESIDGTGEDGGWTDLPDEIRVITPPSKTEYEEGEPIDYTGIVVQAYKNGNVWENSEYPNGIIPFNELILSGELYKSSELIPDIKIKDTKEINITANNLRWEYGRYNSNINDYEVVDYNSEAGEAKLYNPSEDGSRLCVLWAITVETTSGISPYNDYRIGLLKASLSESINITEDWKIGTGNAPGYSHYGRIYYWYIYFMDGGTDPGYSSDGGWQSTNVRMSDSAISGFPDIARRTGSFLHNGKRAYYRYATPSVASGFYGNKLKIEGQDIINLPLPQPDVTYNLDTDSIEFYPASSNKYTANELGAVAWTMLYGDVYVSVQWARPRDNEILSAFFEITIKND